jgi:hypothetical protein
MTMRAKITKHMFGAEYLNVEGICPPEGLAALEQVLLLVKT